MSALVGFTIGAVTTALLILAGFSPKSAMIISVVFGTFILVLAAALQ
jgi:ABC-type uncharacterized transport system permease subunit